MKKMFMAACCAVMPALPAMAFQPAARHSADEFHAHLTLDDALFHALESHPALDVARSNTNIAHLRRTQAKLRPDLQLSLESENLAGRGDFNGLGGHESTLALSRTLELGGKRAKRAEVAGFDVTLADWNRQAIRLRVLETTYLAFIDALAAQSFRTQEAEKYELAKAFDARVQARVEAGKVSPLEGQRSRINLANARIHWDQAKQRFLTVRKVLAGHLGNQVTRFETVIGDLASLQVPPAPEKLAIHLKNHPDLARQIDEKRRQEARLGLAKATRVPDLTVKAGYRVDGVTDDGSWVVGLSLPLPNTKRNRAVRAQAQAEVKKVDQQKAALEHLLWIEFTEIYENLIGQYQKAKTLEADIVPAARSLLAGTTEGYREGKFSYLQVLDSQRAYFETLKAHTDALSMYHRYKVKLQALLGRDLTSVGLGEWIDG